MFEVLNSAGYDLFMISPDYWYLHVKGSSAKGSFEGSFRDTVNHAVTKLGFKVDDIDQAVQEMLKQDHNAIHFGMYRSMIFTFKRETKQGYFN